LVVGCESLRVPAWHSSSQFGRQIVSSPDPAINFSNACNATFSPIRFCAAWSSEFLRLVRALMERVARRSQVRSDVREREKACEPQIVVLRVGCDVPVHCRGGVMGIGRHEAELAAESRFAPC